MAILSGKHAGVKANGVVRGFRSWKLVMSGSDNDKSNNSVVNFQQLVISMIGAVLTLEGPYDRGAMPFTVGSQVDFILYFDQINNFSLVVTCKIKEVTPDIDIEREQILSIMALSTGSFAGQVE